MLKNLYMAVLLGLIMAPASAASVVASIGDEAITDTDITARVKLMTRQGNTATDNRRQALQNIIDDNIKINYAKNFNAVPSDDDVKKELKRMNLGDMSASERAMAMNAVRAEIAWQIVVARTILPTISVNDEDIVAERNGLAREHGLPLEMTIIRLIDIPETEAKKLKKPKNCDDAMAIATALGGAPQKFTAMQYELSADIRERVAGLSKMTWSPRVDGSVLLVCESKKTKEYGDLDKIIKQNAMFKQAMSVADQQLKQLRRKAVIIINDDRYKL